MVTKEEFFAWLEREKNRRKEDLINREAIDRENRSALDERRKNTPKEIRRKHKDG